MAAKKTIGPTPVEAIVHPDKRSNIPTADAQDFVGAEMEVVQQPTRRRFTSRRRSTREC